MRTLIVLALAASCQPAVAQTVVSPSTARAIKTCVMTFTSPAPAGLVKPVAQFQLESGASIGGKVSADPKTRVATQTKEFPRGSYRYRVKWTGVGQSGVPSSIEVFTCGVTLYTDVTLSNAADLLLISSAGLPSEVASYVQRAIQQFKTLAVVTDEQVRVRATSGKGNWPNPEAASDALNNIWRLVQERATGSGGTAGSLGVSLNPTVPTAIRTDLVRALIVAFGRVAKLAEYIWKEQAAGR